jgi:adenylate cyclase
MCRELKPGCLPKQAITLFLDIRSFIAMSEGFTKSFGNEATDKIIIWLNRYFNSMVECIKKTRRGVVDKYMGDALMAHWGTAYTSGSPENDACNCVKAALLMREVLVKLNREHRNNDPENPNIRIGCGINTGMVTAGQIGSDLRMEYTVIGDPVNIASRLESLNRQLATDILISEDTRKLVGDNFILEEMPPVTIKGLKKNLQTYAVINFSAVTTGPRTLADVRRLLGIGEPL